MKNLARDEQLKLYEQIIANMASGVYIIRVSDGIIVYANPKFEEIFEYNENELIGKHVSEINAPTDKTPEQTTIEITSILNETGEWHGEVKNIKKNGTTFWCHADVSTFEHPDYGKVFVAIHNDINERVKIREKLKKTQILLKSSIESPKDLIIISIDKNYCYLYFNETHKATMKAVYGVDIEIGMNLIDCITIKEDRELAKKCYDLALAGNSYSKTDKYGTEPERFFYETDYNPIYDDNGEIIGATAFAKEITDKKRMELALKESEAKFRELSDFSPAAISIQRTNKIFYVNKAWEILTGYSKEDAKSLSPLQLIHPDMVDEIRQRSDSRLKGEDVINRYDIRLLTKAKEEKWVDISFTIIDFENQKAILSVSFDVTELRLAKKALLNSEQKLKEANTAKSKFFSIIGHDLRSPMASILSSSKLLNSNYSDLDDEKRKYFINGIFSSANQTFFLLDNLLNWSRTQQGGITINKETLNLKEFVKKAINPYISNANQKNISVNNLINENIKVMADEHTTMTVIGNLFNNAIKYSYTGGTIDINASENKNDITISIQDHGIGMNQNKLTNLFKLSENESTPGTNNEKGTGLGLILCKDFVELNGGKLKVESIEGEGSRFSFSLLASK